MVHIKKRKIFLLMLPVLLLCFCKCKPKFSVNSDEEPFPIVYGLLNVLDSVHYVKVFKSFVVEGNVYDVVKDIDMYSYIDSIEVSINEYDANDKFIRKILMDTTTSVPKDSGLFSYPTQIAYTAKAVLNKDYKYEIVVFNPYTKNIAKSKEHVQAVGMVKIKRPAGSDISLTEKEIIFEFYSGENSKMYQLLLKYYYTEDFYDGTSRQPRPVVWDLGTLVDRVGAAGSVHALPVSSGMMFFEKIGEQVLHNDNVKARHTDSIVLEIHSAGKDWTLYVQSNLPSSGINQDRLQYTNIIAHNTETGEAKYATGIFSLRGVTPVKYNDLASVSGSRGLLFYGQYTGHLRFTDIY